MEAAAAVNRVGAMPWAAASRPLAGQALCGDAAWTWAGPGRLQVAVMDGLGHGHDAALASRTACETLDTLAGADLETQLQALHLALRRTRGAALALGQADLREGLWTWCGVGNIGGLLLRPHEPHERLNCQSGIVGLNSLGKPRLRPLPLPPGSLVVLHSDGVEELPSDPPPQDEPLQALADRLLRQRARAGDDALVWAGRVDA